MSASFIPRRADCLAFESAHRQVDHEVRCPHCNQKMVKDHHDGEFFRFFYMGSDVLGGCLFSMSVRGTCADDLVRLHIDYWVHHTLD